MPRRTSASGFLWNPTGQPNAPVIVSRDRYEDPAPIFTAPASAPPQERPLFLVEYRTEERAPRSALPSTVSDPADYRSLQPYTTEPRRPFQSRSTARRLGLPPPRPATVIHYPTDEPFTVPPPSSYPAAMIPARPRLVLPAPLQPPIFSEAIPPPAPEVPRSVPQQGGQHYYTPASDPVRETPPSLRVNIPTPPSSGHSRQGSQSSPLTAESVSSRGHRSRASGSSSGRRKHRRTETPDTPVSAGDRNNPTNKMIEEANYQPPPWQDATEVTWKRKDGSKRTQYQYY